MRQHKFCPDKQQYNNAEPFPVYAVVIKEVENYYECKAWYLLLHDSIHYSIVFECPINPTHASSLVSQGMNL